MENEPRNEQHLRLRRNMFGGLNSPAKMAFACSMFIYVSQLISTVVILSIVWHQSCDANLQLWLIGFIIGTAIYIPMAYYDYKHPLIGDDQLYPNARVFQTLKTFFEIIVLMWFVLGNSYVFGSSTCQDTAPVLYRLSLAWIITGYIRLGFPLLLCLGIVFCFPCILMIMNRVSTVTPVSDDLERQIQALPVTKFEVGSIPAEDASCVICMEEYQPNAEVRTLPCKHHFHKSCSDTWLRLHPTCPLCVRPIEHSTA